MRPLKKKRGVETGSDHSSKVVFKVRVSQGMGFLRKRSVEGLSSKVVFKL